jgi:hypothetical protein
VLDVPLDDQFAIAIHMDVIWAMVALPCDEYIATAPDLSREVSVTSHGYVCQSHGEPIWVSDGSAFAEAAL